MKLVVHTFKEYKRQRLNKTFKSQNRDVTKVSFCKKPFCTDANPIPFAGEMEIGFAFLTQQIHMVVVIFS